MKKMTQKESKAAPPNKSEKNDSLFCRFTMPMCEYTKPKIRNKGWVEVRMQFIGSFLNTYYWIYLHLDSNILSNRIYKLINNKLKAVSQKFNEGI